MHLLAEGEFLDGVVVAMRADLVQGAANLSLEKLLVRLLLVSRS